MRRRGKPVKTLESRNAPKKTRRRRAATAELQDQLDHRTRELNEALERQTATAEVLKIISSSPGELEPVFQAMLENATRVCEASYGALYVCEGESFRNVALHGAFPTEFAAEVRRMANFHPHPEAPMARAARVSTMSAIGTKRTI